MSTLYVAAAVASYFTDAATADALTTTVAAQQTRTFVVERAGASGPATRVFYFHFDSPGSSGTASMSSTPAISKLSQNWEAGGSNPVTTAYRADLEALPNGATITIQGDASFEGDLNKLEYNTKLAYRRAQAARSAIASGRRPGDS